ncbi:Uncharacterised protein [Legionella busanensis]|uniref:N-acyl amino acid synthase, PEP-CTERM/exosortase system-associated n=1 Tax=Legionella busanensis TaxID=190655 RepID=A0A378JRJ2_9GAMM|nr:hypothetical protein [Legionella busanensis]STX52853.1 Uncharacterised protein [Legionella busanensis]
MKNSLLSLPNETLLKLASECMTQFKLNTNKRFGIYFLNHDSPFGLLSRYVEAKVFWEVYRNDEELLNNEYEEYMPYSNFLLVIDHKEKLPIGSVRMMRPSKIGLKTFHTIVEPPWSCDIQEIIHLNNLSEVLDSVYDITILSIVKEYRASSGFSVGLGVYLSMLGFIFKNDIRYYISVIDVKLFKLLKKIGLDVRVIKGTSGQSFLGSKCSYPTIFDCNQMRADVAKYAKYLSKLKLIGYVLSKTISYSPEINPDISTWLRTSEKVIYPFIKLVPQRLIDKLLISKK